MAWFGETLKSANNTRLATEAGVLNRASKAAPYVNGTVRVVTAPFRGIAKVFGWGGRRATEASLHTGAAVTGAATGFAKTKAGKWIGAGMLATAALVGVGYAASRARKARSEPGLHDAEQELDEAAAALPEGPAEGRGKAEWRNRVRPGTGQEQGFSQPSMNAVPPESVQNLR